MNEEKLQEIERYFDDQMILEALERRVKKMAGTEHRRIILTLYNMAMQVGDTPLDISIGSNYLARAQFNRFRSRS